MLQAALIKDESRFCIRQAGQWVVRAYPPLVDTHAGTEVLQFVFTGTDRHLEHLYLKRYTDRYELLYDYKFNEDGQLSALHGIAAALGTLDGRSRSFPEADGSIPKPDVKYRLSQHGGIVPTPEEGPDLVKVFNQVKVYRTVKELPCVAARHEPPASQYF